MVSGRFKSRSLRRIFKKMPGGKTILHYVERRPNKPQCAKCQKPLVGVIRASTSKVRKVSKSQRRPERPYGGMYCSPCTRRLTVNKARSS